MHHSCTSKNIGFGAFAGAVSGIIFGLLMLKWGQLASVGAIIGLSNPIAGFFTHLFISIFMGVVFALFFYKRVRGRLFGVVWGLLYGFFWWILGSVVIMPLLQGKPIEIQWTNLPLSGQTPSLFGHIIYGTLLGYIYGWLRRGLHP